MNEYRSYMDNLSVDGALHNRIMNRLAQCSLCAPRRYALIRYASAFVCAVLLLVGLWTVPRLMPSGTTVPPVTTPPATGESDTLDKQAYPMRSDLELSLAQAQADPDFGGYVPQRAPSNLVFESSRRTQNQDRDRLSVMYADGMRYVQLIISRLTEEDEGRIVDVNCPETYDLSRYPIPRADSVPAQLRKVVDNPVFRAEELTLAIVKSRAYTVDDVGDVSGYRMRFSVLYGDVVVKVSVKGAEPEDIFGLLEELR